jgi:pyruvate/2-oxoglutarate dehydrogenase complex dihydrolipoamide dehydrogenase (E3) component
MTPTAEQFDAIVIGAGEAGAEVASRAVHAGFRVAMVYRPPFGSTCLNDGCVPSKFLIHRARVAHQVRTARRFHVDPGEAAPRIGLDAMLAEKDTLVVGERSRSLDAARHSERVTLLQGEARFTSPRDVAVHRIAFSAAMWWDPVRPS